MNKTMEVFNLLIGVELIIVGLLYLLQLEFESAASWSIFGCMYLVMDKYSIIENMSNNRRFVEYVKYGSAWLGFIISTVFLGYMLLKV